MSHTRFPSVKWLALMAIMLLSCGRSEDPHGLPSDFKNKPTTGKMEYLIAHRTPQQAALLMCKMAMGELDYGEMNIPEARDYAYSHLNEEQMVAFEVVCENFEDTLPLSKHVKFARLAAIEDMAEAAYGLGLGYVASIRENEKTIPKIEAELAALREESRDDPEFYKRFMKGFKIVLEADRHHDLDEKIYLHFISYPDTIK